MTLFHAHESLELSHLQGAAVFRFTSDGKPGGGVGDWLKSSIGQLGCG